MWQARRRFLLSSGAAAIGAAALALPAADAFATQRRPLRIAHTDKESVYWRKTPEGYRGLDADVINEILVRRLGFETSYLVEPWRRAEQAVRDNSADALLTLVNDERQLYATFTLTPMLSVGRAIVYRRDHPQRAAFEAAAELGALLPFVYCYNVGGMTDRDRAKLFARSTSAVSDAQVLVMLAHGRGDFTIESITALGRAVADAGFADLLAFREIPGLGTVDRHFGIRRSLPEHEEWVAEIDAATKAAWADGTIDTMIRAADKLF